MRVPRRCVPLRHDSGKASGPALKSALPRRAPFRAAVSKLLLFRQPRSWKGFSACLQRMAARDTSVKSSWPGLPALSSVSFDCRHGTSAGVRGGSPGSLEPFQQLADIPFGFRNLAMRGAHYSSPRSTLRDGSIDLFAQNFPPDRFVRYPSCQPPSTAFHPAPPRGRHGHDGTCCPESSSRSRILHVASSPPSLAFAGPSGQGHTSRAQCLASLRHYSQGPPDAHFFQQPHGEFLVHRVVFHQQNPEMPPGRSPVVR